MARVLHGPVLAAALLALPGIGLEVLTGGGAHLVGVVLLGLCWLVFAAEVVLMLAVVPDRLGWARQHRLEVFVVLVSSPLLPVLGGVALLGPLARVVKLLKLVKGVKLLKLAKVRRLLGGRLGVGCGARATAAIPALLAVVVLGSWLGLVGALVGVVIVALVLLGGGDARPLPDPLAPPSPAATRTSPGA